MEKWKSKKFWKNIYNFKTPKNLGVFLFQFLKNPYNFQPNQPMKKVALITGWENKQREISLLSAKNVIVF